MEKTELVKKAHAYLKKLCVDIPERSVGSEGNIMATDFFYNEMNSLGWQTRKQEFNAMDWKSDGAKLRAGGKNFTLYSSPYSNGCNVRGVLTAASTVAELEKLDAKEKLLLLYGPIVKEQLMPKNFIFYNPDEHKKLVQLLENSGARCIICATGRNSAPAGGAYPFPFIEDGDFNIPSVYTKDTEGEKLLPFIGAHAELFSSAVRIPGKGYNIIASKGKQGDRKIVITAHIDAKKGTPGAIDNATGVITLLLLAGLLKNYNKNFELEIIAFNGEDYYAVPGQMEYIKSMNDNFGNIMLNINIDGAGYFEGNTSFSLFGLPEELENSALSVISSFAGISEGALWPQGDHSIFVQYGVPAIAVSSKWFVDNMDIQDITHTPKDNPSIVDINKLVEIPLALKQFIESL
jgi:aminopeptidase YwaD